MLLAAYAKSLKTDKPLDIDGFVTGYAEKEYGLNQAQAQQFWKALKTTPYQVMQGKVVSSMSISVGQLLDSTVQASKVLETLNPLRNQDEFSQYALMMNIRVQYLTYESIEEKLNAPSFDKSKMPAILTELKAVIEMGKTNDRLFSKYNADYLYPGEIAEENNLRDAKARLLYDRLTRQK